MSLCPHCKKPFTNVAMKEVGATFPGATTLRAISYDCPACDMSLGVEIDPIAVRTEIVAQVKAALTAR